MDNFTYISLTNLSLSIPPRSFKSLGKIALWCSSFQLCTAEALMSAYQKRGNCPPKEARRQRHNAYSRSLMEISLR
jgi:hypothetical protein